MKKKPCTCSVFNTNRIPHDVEIVEYIDENGNPQKFTGACNGLAFIGVIHDGLCLLPQVFSNHRDPSFHACSSDDLTCPHQKAFTRCAKLYGCANGGSLLP